MAKHKHDPATIENCAICISAKKAQAERPVFTICAGCRDQHHEVYHELMRAGFPHSAAAEQAAQIEAKVNTIPTVGRGWHAELYCENQACDIREIRSGSRNIMMIRRTCAARSGAPTVATD